MGERIGVMATVTKKDLIERIATQTGIPRTDVRRMLQAMLDIAVHEFEAGNRIEFRDYGVFNIKIRAPREAKNPKTGVLVQVPERRSVHFKPGRLVREALTRPRPEVTIRLTGTAVDARANHRMSAGG